MNASGVRSLRHNWRREGVHHIALGTSGVSGFDTERAAGQPRPSRAGVGAAGVDALDSHIFRHHCRVAQFLIRVALRGFETNSVLAWLRSMDVLKQALAT